MMRSLPLHFSDQCYSLLPEEDGKYSKLRDLFDLAPDRIVSIDMKDDDDLLKMKVK